MTSSSRSNKNHRVIHIEPIESDQSKHTIVEKKEPISEVSALSRDKLSSSSQVSMKNKKEFVDTQLPEISGREKLKKHRIEVAGQVWIPDIWGQEELLEDWIDCAAFDSSLVPNELMSARASLVKDAQRTTSGGLRIKNRC